MRHRISPDEDEDQDVQIFFKKLVHALEHWSLSEVVDASWEFEEAQLGKRTWQ